MVLKDLVDVSDGESAATKNRKLLARILIKGEANITSAAISDDGSLLVVSTTTDIKAFHLKPRGDARKDELKISKIDIPEGVAARGATRIQIAPDGQWLCLIQESSNVCVFRLIQDANSESKPAVHPKAIRLQRLGRKIPKHIALGGLGQYERTVTHIAFSPDSKMLAVADLAGYIDTWVLRRPTPKLQNGVNGDHHHEDSDANTSDEEDGNVEDEDSAPYSSDSARWMRNPSAALLPKLHAAPTVLSFSSHVPGTTTTNPTTTTTTSTNQQEGSSPTHDDDDDYVLLTITAKPQVLLLNPSLGALTSWSRRNPVSRFPVEFRNIRDLVKGALWSGDRVWLYGSNFLAMLDFTKDVATTTTNTTPATIEAAGRRPAEKGNQSSTALVAASNGQVQQQQGRKRKRGPDTGAGNKMDIGALGPTKVVRHRGGHKAEELSLERSRHAITPDPMDTDATSGPGEEEEEDDDDDDDSESGYSDEGGARRGELALLRRGGGTATQQHQQGGAAGASTSSSSSPSAGGGGLSFWCTYKYRPILGIVALSPSGDEGEEHVAPETETERTAARARTLEVALVERPMWEVDMPDRYFADGEYDR
ncbi:U3 small nucleolar RNA-associated protein [Diatrype stigma]|uniref:U3 small nucleolar RNA-associated protein n=1 Tax=Diatrype stigma TaxID=117547 RepID=A0AAN9V141_9PEZI